MKTKHLIISATIDRFIYGKTPYVNVDPATRALLERHFARTKKGTRLRVTLEILPPQPENESIISPINA
jgi:hypothetical protein